ncbi:MULTISPECIES: DUF2513 domain-containing protein [unclassified Erysipelothrix]|uniref:DUF2513 domain-containing protein n=1 Tax=unclassified Erysipelothrix TaxID=2624170 RepID=UPI0013782A72|nr:MULTISPECIES: DUF2513 domain-containing protein [unclassified Erysipelothrix]MBK2401599.1 DUF2513 domain-containing protein [Erysipelothrix sp. strain 2 (EsS2-6-Brazil)]MBK2403281.1 DUF2513 domain-containing protein [Erysipelothrix sp. strain 2 (EsS2-7-Brazil)]NBA00752.1 DUF2513 domain-containing protein [Erysipelothrix rhusiopathiae]
MKLNIDCVRDILLHLDHPEPTITFEALSLGDLQNVYQQHECLDHLRKMHHAHIVTLSQSDSENPSIQLTPNGRNLIDAVKDDRLYQEFKKEINEKYPIYTVEIFAYGLFAYRSTRYGL